MNRSIRKVSLILLALTMVLTMGVSLLLTAPSKTEIVSAESAQSAYVNDFETEEDESVRVTGSVAQLHCWPRAIDSTFSLTGNSSLKVTPHPTEGQWPKLVFKPTGETWDLTGAYSVSIWVNNRGEGTINGVGFIVTDTNDKQFLSRFGDIDDVFVAGDGWIRHEIKVSQFTRHVSGFDISSIKEIAFGQHDSDYTNRSAFNVDNFRVNYTKPTNSEIASQITANVDNFRVNYTKPTNSEIASQITAMAEDLTMMTGASIYAPTAENSLNRGIRFGMTLPKANYDAMLELAEPNGIKLDFGLFVKPQTTGYSYELSDKNLFQEGALYYWDDNDLSTWNGYPTTNPKTGNTLYEGWSAEIYDIYNLLPREYEDTVYLYGFLVGFDGAPSITRDYVCRGYVTVSVDGVRSNVLANYVDENGVSIGRDAATTVAERNEKEANVMRSMFDVAMAVADNDESLRSALEKAYFTSDVKNVDTKININVKLDGVTKYTTQIDGKLYSPVDTSKLSYDTSKGVNCSKGLTVVSNVSALENVRAGRSGKTTVDVEFITDHGFDKTWVIGTNGTYTSDGTYHKKTCTCGVVDTTKTKCAGGTATCLVKATCSTCKAAWGSLGAHDFAGSSTYAKDAVNKQHWKVCSRNGCGVEDTSNKVTCSGAAATCTLASNCTICKQQLAASLGHDYTNNKYGSDDTNHWIICERCAYKKDIAAHSYSQKYDANNHWNECSTCKKTKDTTAHASFSWVTTNATNHWQKCGSCAYTKNSGAHSYSQKYDTNNHWNECGTCKKTKDTTAHASFSWVTTDATNHWQKCGSCAYTKNSGAHSYSQKYNTNNHWNECGTCAKTKDTTAHASFSWVTTDATNHWQKCGSCAYTKNSGAHSYSQNYNTSNHWNECSTCAKTKDTTAHTASSNYTTNDSQHWKKCTGCAYKMNPENHVVGTAATFWAAAKCKTCSQSYGSVRATSNYAVGAWNDDSDKYVADRYTSNVAQDAWDIGISTETKYSGAGGLQIDRKNSAQYPIINFAWNNSEYWNLSDVKQVSIWVCCPAAYNNVIGLSVGSKAFTGDSPTYAYTKTVTGQTGGKWLQIVIDMKDVLEKYPSIGLSSCLLRFISNKYVDQSSFFIDELVITAGTEQAASDLWGSQQKETRYNFVSGNENLFSMFDPGSFVPAYSQAGRSRGCIEVTLPNSSWGTWWSTPIKQTSSNERWSLVGATEVSVLVWQNTGKSVPFWIELRHYENSQYVDCGGSSVVNVPNNTWTRISVTLNSEQQLTNMRIQLCVSGEYNYATYGATRAVKVDEFAIRRT